MSIPKNKNYKKAVPTWNFDYSLKLVNLTRWHDCVTFIILPISLRMFHECFYGYDKSPMSIKNCCGAEEGIIHSKSTMPVFRQDVSDSKVPGTNNSAHLGPTGAPCWPHKLCYEGSSGHNQMDSKAWNDQAWNSNGGYNRRLDSGYKAMPKLAEISPIIRCISTFDTPSKAKKIITHARYE